MYTVDTLSFVIQLDLRSSVAGIVESLRKLLKDDDVTIRQKSTECLYVMSCKQHHHSLMHLYSLIIS